MESLGIIMDVETQGFTSMRGMGPEDRERIVHIKTMEIGALERGMTSGRASVAFCFELPDGTVVVAETTLRLLQAATSALTARYGEGGA